MKLQKYMVLIGSGVAFILMLAALFMLYSFYRSYDRVSKELQSSMGQLRLLQARAPYPSSENAALMQTNLVIVQNYLNGLFQFLKQRQIEPVEVEAAKFTPLLRDSILRVGRSAQAAGVILPATFDLGMERYKRGDLPSAADVPRLIVQLKSLEALFDLLINAKVTEVDSIRREVFEKQGASQENSADAGRWGRWGTDKAAPAPKAAPAQSMPSMDSGGLFFREHFTIEYKCREESVWAILNALAKGQLFTVVTSLVVLNENPVPKIAPKSLDSAAPGAIPASESQTAVPEAPTSTTGTNTGHKFEIKTQEQRIIAGREIVKVVMDVDVYRFLDEKKQEAKL